MGIAEKKAMRATTETLTSELTQWNEKAGLKVEGEIDYSSIESDETAITKAANVPVSLVQYLSTLTEDADYKEAFEEVKGIKFVPVGEDGFDYETSATLNDGVITVSFLPMQSFHGGYERAVKGLF